MNEIDCKIIRELGSLGDGRFGKRVRLIEWNNRQAKVDIRTWNGQRPDKGITLSDDEVDCLIDVLTKYRSKTVI